MAHPLAGKDARFCINFIAIGDKHSTIACTQIFCCVKTVGSGSLQPIADQASLIAAPKRMRCIFAYIQAVFIGNGIDTVQIAYLPAVMYRNNGFRPGSNFFFNLVWIDATSPIINIRKYRGSARVDNGARGGSECHWSCNHFVAWTNPFCKQRNMQCRCTGVHSNGVLCTEITGKFLFKTVGSRAFCNPTGFQGFYNFVDFRIGNVRYIIRDKIVPFLKITHESIASFSHKIWAYHITCNLDGSSLQICCGRTATQEYFTPNMRFY